MDIYDKNQKVIKIICNRCGHAYEAQDGLFKADFVTVQKQWGYFSDKDTQIHSFDLCETCYDEICRDFVIPVEKKAQLEI